MWYLGGGEFRHLLCRIWILLVCMQQKNSVPQREENSHAIQIHTLLVDLIHWGTGVNKKFTFFY